MAPRTTDGTTTGEAGAKTTRRYDSARRTASAAATRIAILDAARASFVERGWAGTSMRGVATAARVSVETVYSSVGSKDELLKVCLDVAVVGDDEPIPLADRPEFQALASGGFPERAAACGRFLAQLHGRTGRLRAALEHAATASDDVAGLLASARRTERESFRQGMAAVFGRDLAPDHVEECRAVLGPEVFVILTEVSGWTIEQYERWVAEMLTRLDRSTRRGG